MKVILHGLLTDNQDGGYSLGLFGSASDVLAHQIERNDGKVADFEDDPYEHGYRDEVELDFDDEGKLRKPVYFGFGQ